MGEIGHNSAEYDRACEAIACLTVAQRKQLLGIPPQGRSEYGGRTGTVDALIRKGIYRNQFGELLTPFGELIVSIMKEDRS